MDDHHAMLERMSRGFQARRPADCPPSLPRDQADGVVGNGRLSDIPDNIHADTYTSRLSTIALYLFLDP